MIFSLRASRASISSSLNPGASCCLTRSPVGLAGPARGDERLHRLVGAADLVDMLAEARPPRPIRRAWRCAPHRSPPWPSLRCEPQVCGGAGGLSMPLTSRRARPTLAPALAACKARAARPAGGVGAPLRCSSCGASGRAIMERVMERELAHLRRCHWRFRGLDQGSLSFCVQETATRRLRQRL